MIFIYLFIVEATGKESPGPPNPEAAFTAQPQESQPEMGSKSCSVALLPHRSGVGSMGKRGCATSSVLTEFLQLC